MTPSVMAHGKLRAIKRYCQLVQFSLLSPVLTFFGVVVVVVVVARQFHFQQSFQYEINYRKYPDLCIICTPWLTNQFYSKTRKPSYRWQTRATQKACQKLLHFDVLTTLSLTILAYLHSFSCCCVRNLRNHAKFTENSNLWSSRSSKVIDLGVNRKPMY